MFSIALVAGLLRLSSFCEFSLSDGCVRLFAFILNGPRRREEKKTRPRGRYLISRIITTRHSGTEAVCISLRARGWKYASRTRVSACGTRRLVSTRFSFRSRASGRSTPFQTLHILNHRHELGGFELLLSITHRNSHGLL